MGECMITSYSALACSADLRIVAAPGRVRGALPIRLPTREQTGAVARKGLERHEQRV